MGNKLSEAVQKTVEPMKMLWSYLAAIQMQDINTNEGTERFNQARGYYNQVAWALTELEAAIVQAEEEHGDR